MPGDPRECRERALRCAELAVTARTQQLKEALELSKNWEILALQLEEIQALLSGGSAGPGASGST